MKDWIKQNLIAGLTFIILCGTLTISTITQYVSLSKDIQELKEDVSKITKNYDKDKDNHVNLDKRLTLMENTLENRSTSFNKLNLKVDALSQQSQDYKAQSIVVNNAVVSLNGTLDKMNNTLDRLNETVIIVGQDVNHLKKEVEEIKEKQERN